MNRTRRGISALVTNSVTGLREGLRLFTCHSCKEGNWKRIHPPEQDGVVQLRLRGLLGRPPSVHRGQKDLKRKRERKSKRGRKRCCYILSPEFEVSWPGRPGERPSRGRTAHAVSNSAAASTTPISKACEAFVHFQQSTKDLPARSRSENQG
jgi:hypothetical protein